LPEPFFAWVPRLISHHSSSPHIEITLLGDPSASFLRTLFAYHTVDDLIPPPRRSAPERGSIPTFPTRGCPFRERCFPLRLRFSSTGSLSPTCFLPQVREMRSFFDFLINFLAPAGPPIAGLYSKLSFPGLLDLLPFRLLSGQPFFPFPTLGDGLPSYLLQ